jgi:hypothetical protein
MRQLHYRYSDPSDSVSFLLGFPNLVMIVYIPQRVQFAMDLSSLAAGINQLPLLVFSAVGWGVAGSVSFRFPKAMIPMLVVGCGMQVLALGLMLTVPSSRLDGPEWYVYQSILGLGFGLPLSVLSVVSRNSVERDDSSMRPRRAFLSQK